MAVKCVGKQKLGLEYRQKRLLSEILVQNKLNHECLCSLYEAFETKEAVLLIMEYVNGGSLSEYLEKKEESKLPEWEAKALFQ